MSIAEQLWFDKLTSQQSAELVSKCDFKEL